MDRGWITCIAVDLKIVTMVFTTEILFANMSIIIDTVEDFVDYLASVDVAGN